MKERKIKKNCEIRTEEKNTLYSDHERTHPVVVTEGTHMSHHHTHMSHHHTH